MAEPFEEAKTAWQSGDSKTALKLFNALAGQNNTDAQYALAYMYFTGVCAPQDYAEARRWLCLAIGPNKRSLDKSNLRKLGPLITFLYAEALRWFFLAIDRGISLSPDSLRSFLSEADAEAVPWFQPQTVSQDRAKETKWLFLAAKAGASEAQHFLGRRYELTKDYPHALSWYRLAAEQKFYPAYSALGTLHLVGHGVQQDDSEAAKWFLLGANLGVPHDQSILGMIYLKGWGVSRDSAVAAKWFGLAAECYEYGVNSIAEAQYWLGYMYFKGEGIPHDFAQAASWFHRAAKIGTRRARYGLGILYENGWGVAQDYIHAIRYYDFAVRGSTQEDYTDEALNRFRFACECDNLEQYKFASSQLPASEKSAREMAIQNRAKLAAKMTADQIAEAEKTYLD